MTDKLLTCPWCQPPVTFLTQADLTAHMKAAIARVPAYNAPAVNPVDHKYYYIAESTGNRYDVGYIH